MGDDGEGDAIFEIQGFISILWKFIAASVIAKLLRLDHLPTSYVCTWLQNWWKFTKISH